MKHFCPICWVSTSAALLLALSVSASGPGKHPAGPSEDVLCTIACNNLVQISLPEEGFAVVLPDMVLDGDDTSCPGPKLVQVMLPNGQNLGDTVTCEQVNEVLNARVTDVNTGNYCWGTILVEDKLPPVLTCQDTTVNCTADLDPDSIGLVAVTDNCDPDPNLTFSQNMAPQPCASGLTQIVTRTWFASDASGNMAPPCVQTIELVRPALSDVVFPPNFDGTDEPALPCENGDTTTANTGLPMVDGLPVGNFCKIDLSYQDNVVQGCEAQFSVFRLWTVLDCCSGEIITHTQHIWVRDFTAPVLDCPAALTVSANGPDCDGYFVLPAVSATDNCASQINFETTIPGLVGIAGNGGPVYGLPLGTYTLTYEASDPCQNASSCDVELTVADNVAPVAVCDEITAVSLGSQGLASVAATVFDDGSYDACCGVEILAKRMDEPAAPFEPNVIFDCEDHLDTVMVIVQVTDCSGNSNTCMVEVLPADKTPPAITCPPNVTIECFEWPAPPSVTGEPTVQENCSIDTLIFNDQENLDLCRVGNITRTFTVTDHAGRSASCSHTITTIDTTPVQYFFPADTMVDCSRPLDSISAGQVFAISDCELIGLSHNDEIFPIPCGLKIFRTYTFLDWCSGFDTSYTQFIEVIDTNPPMWDQPLGSKDTAYVCPGDLVKPPPPTATDFCTPATVTLELDSIEYFGCDNRYVRTIIYSAADTCGNVAEPFVITLVVNDTVPPHVDDLDDQGPFNCFADLPPFDPADVPALDNCLNTPVTVTLESQSPDPGMCMGTVVRTYRLTDECGNDTLVMQNFLINDTLPPTANFEPLGPYTCLSQVPDEDPDHVLPADNCGGEVTVEFVSEEIDTGACAAEVRRNWMLTDSCGNDTIVQQVILVNDTIPPVLNCPDSVVVNIFQEICEANVGVTVGAADNCGGPVTFSNSYDGGGASIDGNFPLGTTVVVFYAEDACGNIDSCTVPIIVHDRLPPENSCSSFDQDIAPAGLTVLDLEALVAAGEFGGEDFCTDVTFSIEPAMVSCDNYVSDPTPIPYTLTVTDAAGNTSSCSNTMLLWDPLNVCPPFGPPVVGGRVFLPDETPMEGLEMRLAEGQNMMTTSTGEHGVFLFENPPQGASCDLQPFKNDDLLNGVTTFDLVLITKHILGVQPITSPYRLIAADVNRSGGISTFDIVNLRKAVLQTIDAFPNNTSWRFVEAGYQFPDPANPFAEPFPESTWLPNMAGNLMPKNFVGVKIGDINGSAAPSLWDESLDERASEWLGLAANDRAAQPGETIRVPVFSESGTDLVALQATIQFDPQKMAFRGLSGAALDIEGQHFAEVSAGLVTLAWDNAAGRTLAADDHLFLLHFEILENVSLGEALFVNSLRTPAIGYGTAGNPLNIDWRIHAASPVPVGAPSLFELAQNRPNPFSGETTVGFQLAEPMPVRLEIVDLAGRRTTVLDAHLATGRHELPLGPAHFGGSGVYLCQLVTPHGTEQRRMVYAGR